MKPTQPPPPTPVPELLVRLLSKRIPPPDIKQILAVTAARSDEDCRLAWEALDASVPGDFTTLLTKAAEQGLSVPRIYRLIRNAYPKPLPPELQELMALAVEHAVRQFARS